MFTLPLTYATKAMALTAARHITGASVVAVDRGFKVKLPTPVSF